MKSAQELLVPETGEEGIYLGQSGVRLRFWLIEIDNLRRGILNHYLAKAWALLIVILGVDCRDKVEGIGVYICEGNWGLSLIVCCRRELNLRLS